MMKVSEIFVSVQGEGRYVGVPMIFIRLAGCNLKCKWCDTKYSWDEEKAQIMTPVEVSTIVMESKLQNVCITGGEPMMQYREVMELIRYLKWGNKRVHLETNGSIDFDERSFDYVVVSPKDVETMDRWWFRDVDLKIVVSKKNWDEWKEALLNGFEKGRRLGWIFLMPMGRTNNELRDNVKPIIDDIIESFGDFVRLSPRMQLQIGIK